MGTSRCKVAKRVGLLRSSEGYRGTNGAQLLSRPPLRFASARLSLLNKTRLKNVDVPKSALTAVGSTNAVAGILQKQRCVRPRVPTAPRQDVCAHRRSPVIERPSHDKLPPILQGEFAYASGARNSGRCHRNNGHRFLLGRLGHRRHHKGNGAEELYQRCRRGARADLRRQFPARKRRRREYGPTEKNQFMAELRREAAATMPGTTT